MNFYGFYMIISSGIVAAAPAVVAEEGVLDLRAYQNFWDAQVLDINENDPIMAAQGVIGIGYADGFFGSGLGFFGA